LELGQDRGVQAFGDPVESYQGGPPDEGGDVVVDTCHGKFLHERGAGAGPPTSAAGSARHATTRTLEPGALQTGAAAAQGGGGGGERAHGCGDSSHANTAGGSPASLNP